MLTVAELVLNRAEVKRRREALGLTMDAAAQAAGLSSRQAWYMIEVNPRGSDVTVGTLGRVARALKCDPDDLLTTPAD